jgi:hypothetical protein
MLHNMRCANIYICKNNQYYCMYKVCCKPQQDIHDDAALFSVVAVS